MATTGYCGPSVPCPHAPPLATPVPAASPRRWPNRSLLQSSISSRGHFSRNPTASDASYETSLPVSTAPAVGATASCIESMRTNGPSPCCASTTEATCIEQPETRLHRGSSTGDLAGSAGGGHEHIGLHHRERLMERLDDRGRRRSDGHVAVNSRSRQIAEAGSTMLRSANCVGVWAAWRARRRGVPGASHRSPSGGTRLVHLGGWIPASSANFSATAARRLSTNGEHARGASAIAAAVDERCNLR